MKILSPILFFIGVYTSIVVYLISDYFQLSYESTVAIHSLMGIVLGLFLVFRTNSAYDRWWEGRKLWGTLVNNTRSLAMKINAFIDPDDHKSRKFFKAMIPNFAYATKEHLRENIAYNELVSISENFIDELNKVDHVPNKLTSLMYEKVTHLYNNGKIKGEQLFLLDKELKAFTDVVGSCERIKNTPIPYSYSMFIKKFIFTFILTLPIGIATEFHYWTIPIVLLLFYILLSIELIAEEIEDPFGTDINDLPTDFIAKKIKNNVEEIIK